MDGFFELSIGGFQLLFPAYSTFVGLGAMLFMFCFYAQISKLGISYYQFLACCFLMGVGMVLGSKTLFILTCLPEVFNNFSWQLLWNTIATSGFVFYGGLFGAIAGVLAASRIIGIKFNDLLNAVVLGFPLFHACGRIGCFFTGCCYGIKWDSRLFAGISPGAYVYFVHSYYLEAEDESVVAASAEYSVHIHAAVERGNVFACQFHPEKSGDVGLKILKNFVEM